MFLTGEDLIDTQDLMCNFGNSAVQARLISSTEVECVSPPYSHAGEINVSITLNGIHDTATEALTFRYYTESIISSFQPLTGPSLGGTRVSVTMTDVISDHDDFVCLFGLKSAKGQYVDENTVECVTPPA